MEGILLEPVRGLIHETQVTLGHMDRLALNARFFKQVAQDHVIVPSHLQKLVKLGKSPLNPARLDDDGAVAFKDVYGLTVLTRVLTFEIIRKCEPREAPCAPGVDPVPLEEVRDETIIICRVIVQVHNEILGVEMNRRTYKLCSGPEVLTVSVDADLWARGFGNSRGAVPLGPASILPRHVEPDFVTGLPAQGLEHGAQMNKAWGRACETHDDFH